MENQNNINNMENQNNYDEIDLMDYVLVLVKRKKTILTIFLAAILISFFFSVLSSKVYRVETILEIGIIDNQLIEKPQEVIAKIEGGTYEELTKIYEKDYKIKAENPEKTNFLRFEIETSKTQEALIVLRRLNEIILTEHGNNFEEKKLILEQSITEIQEQLDFLRNHKIYADQGISDLQRIISSKRDVLNEAELSRVIKQPTVSRDPISPNIKLNIAIAGILGLFIGIFVAFFEEWWLKAKK